jgi:hypothetical protein
LFTTHFHGWTCEFSGLKKSTKTDTKSTKTDTKPTETDMKPTETDNSPPRRRRRPFPVVRNWQSRRKIMFVAS